MQKTDWKKELKNFSLCILGALVYALGINLFLAGNDIAAGGLVGIAIVLRSFIPMEIGTLLFLLNIPLLVFSVYVKKWKYTAYTLVLNLIYSAMLNGLSILPTVTTNRLIASLFGGLSYGVGAYFLYLGGCSVGGTDLLSRLLVVKLKKLSLGKMILVIDGLIILFAVVMFRDIEIGLVAIITLFICSLVIDLLISRLNSAHMCYIILQGSPEPVANAIMAEFSSGVTLLKGIGMYEGKERNILLSVVKLKHIESIKRIVSLTDPCAFVVISTADEVMGGGFKPVGSI